MVGNSLLDSLNSLFNADSQQLQQQQADLTSGLYLMGGLLAVTAVVVYSSD